MSSTSPLSSFSFNDSTDFSYDTSDSEGGSHSNANYLSSSQKFSIFSDGSCGEPLVTQHVLIDFTPNEEDNEIVQKKVCSFWKFVHDTPEIQNLMALPERGTPKRLSSAEEDTSLKGDINTEAELKSAESKNERTALSVLEFVEEKGLMGNAFAAKLPKTLCSLGSREYKEVTQDTRKKMKPCACKTPCNPCPGLMRRGEVVKKTKLMCKKMEEWDAHHPKSMEPPGHPPSLQHAVLQRPLYRNY